jgi:molybdopterin converting factor small subunit
MRITVKLFAGARELAGSDVISIELGDGATIGELRKAVAGANPALARILPHAFWAVDANYAEDSTIVCEKSAVALIPPVSGG